MTTERTKNGGSPLKAWTRALALTAPLTRHSTLTLPRLIDQLADRFGSAPALLSHDSTLSYRQLADACQRYARWGLAQGLVAGDVVCLLMPNCPAYMAIWLGLSRIGVTVSLLNTNLRGVLLAHAVNLVAPRCLIVGAALAESLSSARTQIPATLQCWAHGPGAHHLPRLDVVIGTLGGAALTDGDYPLPSLEDRALYIYTSGTTGLPKAANVSHFRLMQWSHWFAGLMDTGPHDRMYNCLPMYHSIGGVVAAGATLVGGGAVVLRERFSVRDFWRDVTAERCTLFQYIGELCRYLVNGAPHPDETRHALRLCCGNGLQASIWEQFKQRFQIPQILEYYAATEGNFSLYNCEGRPGAIGKIPAFLSHRLPVALIQFDLAAGEPRRADSGLCVRCAPNEVGEAIGELIDASGKSISRFEGYADAAASKKKILHDVFARGDAWYRTGDLMRQDAQGYFYFVDRVGDTFRWKGENVSTTEVTAVISGCPGVLEAAVYGVPVPGAEGRAGMAAVVVNAQFDLQAFRQKLATLLPDYARPLFLRLTAQIELTGTFKLRKQELSVEGYDPARIADPLYIDDKQRQAYVSLTASCYEQLQSGSLRL